MFDQLGRHIDTKTTFKRVVSLVPSQTELLCDLGLEEHLVGVTKFCVHPSAIKKQKLIVGGTKNIKWDVVKSLQPDIVLCNKEENTKEIVEKLEAFTNVHVSDIYTLNDCYGLMKQYGILFNVEEKAERLISNIQSEANSFLEFIQNSKPAKVAYFIWRKPWMVAGGDTFIDHLLMRNGFENVFGSTARYPEVELYDLVEKEIDYVLLSSEPFPFKEKHIKELQHIRPDVKIVLVDGEYFSWYGSRLKSAFLYFRSLRQKLIP